MKHQNEISWTAPEYAHYPKSRGWYITFLLIAAVMFGTALFRKDVLMMAVLVIIFTIAFVMSRRAPNNAKVTLNEQGLKINGLLYRYDSSLRSFWITYRASEIKTLNFESTSYLNREITVQLEDQNPLEIRAFMLKYLPEDVDREESAIDKWLRFLRF
ncbi:MAG: hypothetical protein Q8N81_04415 [bacterium]|nr:hypothetical protein [bacterium]